ncbi:DUF6163 family protein [Aquamicrobium terrae]|uniref:Transmembrane protein n=1 Tax=Aquamicrobium terrae TaxID=1324945 RepID=A0ABV2MTM1_9HYPH
MREELPGRAALEPGTIEIAFAVFLRLIACLCLVSGVLYWIRLIGYYPGDLYRFDLMPVQWQIAASVLAVLFPFAAAGLWMLASWGPVIWFLCAAGEIAMHAGFPQYFGHRPSVVVTHAVVAAIYCGFRAAMQRRRRAEAVQ